VTINENEKITDKLDKNNKNFPKEKKKVFKIEINDKNK
jgi:hypothetical protein